MIILLAIVIAALVAFYLILQTDIPGLWKFWVCAFEMVVVGQVLIRRYKFPSEIGLILLKSKLGLKAIDRLSRREEFWKFFCDSGNAMAYGLSSMVIMRKNMGWKSLAAGLAALVLIWRFVVPAALVFMSQMFGTGMFEAAEADAGAASATEMLWTELLVIAMLIVGGFFLALVLSIVTYGLIVLADLFGNILGGQGATIGVDPGGTVLLPGVNLPFFEGVAALFMILIIHEGAHAVMARIGKIPILSSGIVLFGVIPVGAFVEPDEARLMKLERSRQTRVLIAGSTSNLFASGLFFLLFTAVATVAVDFSILEMDFIGPIVRSIAITLGLAFSLNFIVGSVNLLPLPFFDGYRVLETNIKNKMLLKGLMLITLISFILNFLPWLFV